MARKSMTTPLQVLQMAKLHYVYCLSYSEIATKFNMKSKNTVYNKIKQLKQDEPEFIEDMVALQRYREDYHPQVEETLATEVAQDISMDLDNKVAEQHLTHKL